MMMYGDSEGKVKDAVVKSFKADDISELRNFDLGCKVELNDRSAFLYVAADMRWYSCALTEMGRVKKGSWRSDRY